MERIAAEVNEAIKAAEANGPPAPETLVTDVYAEVPPQLQEQLREVLDLTGCALQVRPDASMLLIGTGGSATLLLAVPPTPTLAGLLLHQQAVVFDRAAANPVGLVMSDAATAVVGL